MPERFQLFRRSGYRMPPNSRSVTRSTRFGNPFKVGTHAANARDAVQLFRVFLDSSADGQQLARVAKSVLRGKNLGCFCKPGNPCHADVLLEVANAEV